MISFELKFIFPDVKRLIGRKEDTTRRNVPFKIIPGQRKLQVCAMHKGVKKNYKPEEISSIVLSTLKTTAEKQIGVSRLIICL